MCGHVSSSNGVKPGSHVTCDVSPWDTAKSCQFQLIVSYDVRKEGGSFTGYTTWKSLGKVQYHQKLYLIIEAGIQNQTYGRDANSSNTQLSEFKHINNPIKRKER